jgi:hypothetical protein
MVSSGVEVRTLGDASTQPGSRANASLNPFPDDEKLHHAPSVKNRLMFSEL